MSKINYQIIPAKAQNKNAIVFAPDNAFIKYFAVTLQSLINNSNEKSAYDIVIFNGDITKENLDRLTVMLPENFNLRLLDIDIQIKEQFKSLILKNQDYWSIAMYYRIFIPFFMQNYKKVLYLDSDMVINSNIDELFNVDFEDKYILACRDTFAIQDAIYQNVKRLEFVKNILKIDDVQYYFNSGMLLFNIAAINLDDYYTKLTGIFNEKLMYPDQDILNFVFYKKAKLISFKYNCSIGYKHYDNKLEEKILDKYKDDFFNSIREPIIIHYTGKTKPWNTSNQSAQGVFADVFWKYARKTSFYEEILLAAVAAICKSQNKTVTNTANSRKKITLPQMLFSVKNEKYKGNKHKVLTFMGIKIKLKTKV